MSNYNMRQMKKKSFDRYLIEENVIREIIVLDDIELFIIILARHDVETIWKRYHCYFFRGCTDDDCEDEACVKEDMECFKYMIKEGLDINHQINPLGLAIDSKNLYLVDEILSFGPRVDIIDENKHNIVLSSLYNYYNCEKNLVDTIFNYLFFGSVSDINSGSVSSSVSTFDINSIGHNNTTIAHIVAYLYRDLKDIKRIYNTLYNKRFDFTIRDGNDLTCFQCLINEDNGKELEKYIQQLNDTDPLTSKHVVDN